MSSRPKLTNTERVRLFHLHDETCHVCGGRITAGQRWEIDHVVSRGMKEDASEADTDDNMRPAHYKCHRDKTSVDARDLGKVRRQHAKSIGGYRPQNVFPGSRTDRLKKRMDGRVEIRAGH